MTLFVCRYFAKCNRYNHYNKIIQGQLIGDERPGSESDSEIECAGYSFQEARDGKVWVEETAGNIRVRMREFNIMRETPVHMQCQVH